jgi:hypothetical protein
LSIISIYNQSQIWFRSWLLHIITTIYVCTFVICRMSPFYSIVASFYRRKNEILSLVWLPLQVGWQRKKNEDESYSLWNNSCQCVNGLWFIQDGCLFCTVVMVKMQKK